MASLGEAMTTPMFVSMLSSTLDGQRLYNAPASAPFDGFGHDGRRYSLLPTIVTQDCPPSIDPLQAHQFSYWRSLSMSRSPMLPKSDHLLHDVSNVHPRKAAERFYSGIRNSNEAETSSVRKLKQRPVLRKVFRKVSALFSHKP